MVMRKVLLDKEMPVRPNDTWPLSALGDSYWTVCVDCCRFDHRARPSASAVVARLFKAWTGLHWSQSGVQSVSVRPRALLCGTRVDKAKGFECHPSVPREEEPSGYLSRYDHRQDAKHLAGLRDGCELRSHPRGLSTQRTKVSIRGVRFADTSGAMDAFNVRYMIF